MLLGVVIIGATPARGFAQGEASEPRPWYERIQFGGDFRSRYEGFYQDGRATRHRSRLRLRLRIDTDINDLSPVYGRSRYSGRFSAPLGESTNNIHNLGDFFVGAQSTQEMSRFVVLEYRQRMHFFYVQDDWKVRPNLTLNLGARYEYATPQWENKNRLGNFDPDTNSLVFAGDGSISDRALVDPDRNNWAPRVGLAYTVNPKTVIRSGYGVSYIHFNRMGGENILSFTGPFVFRRTQNQAAPSSLPLCSPGQSGQNLSTCFTRTQDGFTPDFLADETYDTSISRVNFQPRDTRSGYVQSWHFTIQRELARDLALDVAYVGNRGAKQLILTDFNQARPNGPDENLRIDDRRPIPGFTHIQMSFSGGNTFYHAFQAKLEKRFSRGLYVLNSFTWAVPEEFWKPQPPKLDRQGLISALTAGRDIPGAILGNPPMTISVRTK